LPGTRPRFAYLGVGALAVALLAAPLAAEAQAAGKVHKIGILCGMDCSGPLIDAFRQELRAFGWAESHSVMIEYRWTDGQLDRLLDLAAELVRLKVDLLVGAGTPAIMAASHATAGTPIPIVMAFSGDPVQAGLVASLARPGGNITGLSSLATELTGKRLELLKEVVPKLSRVAVLFNPNDVDMRIRSQEVYLPARKLGVLIQNYGVRESKDFENAFSVMTQVPPDALLMIADSFTFLHRRRVLDFTAKNRLPAIYELREVVDDGGLMAYGPSLAGLFRRAAYYADRILKGANPADLPIEQPTKFELVINLKTAKTLGLTIPPAVLARADEVIQ
jgi:putative tryptophan/tyrosine transport system substrate-binding protein